MISIFNIEKLQNLLKDFYNITHIRITVFDEARNELVSYPREVAPWCRIIRSCPEGRRACELCDQNACAAAEKHGTTIYRCHAGLTEAVRPLYIRDILVGYLLIGHAFAYPSFKEGWAVIEHSCSPLPIDKKALRESVSQATPLSEDYIRSASHILHAMASYLLLERMADLQEDLLAVRVDSYISTHYTEDLSAESICRELSIGKTQLYALSKQLYGCGIAEHIRKLRIDKAKELLLERGDLSLAQISDLCGYHDYNYFITVFKRITGSAPGKWKSDLLAQNSGHVLTHLHI